MQSKHIIVEDKDGNMDKLCIYNWDQLSKAKLALLEKPGTKFILRQYIKKIGK